jgi:hypothetical protein
MGVKLVINGIAGAGKTDLLRTLGDETLVVSRDAKEFGLPLPHVLVDNYVNMSTLIALITDKVNTYAEKMDKYPEIVAIDSVSQITMDVIDKASQTANVYGSQGAEITKEMSAFTKFIHEDLELSGMTVVLLNHVIPEKLDGEETGSYAQFGQGKFLAKGGFYAATNEAITIVPEGNFRAIYTRGVDKQARSSNNSLPDKIWVANTVNPAKSKKLKEGESYFNLKEHIDMLLEQQSSQEKWAL